MFPEIEGDTQMQPKDIGGTLGKKFENPWDCRAMKKQLIKFYDGWNNWRTHLLHPCDGVVDRRYPGRWKTRLNPGCYCHKEYKCSSPN